MKKLNIKGSFDRFARLPDSSVATEIYSPKVERITCVHGRAKWEFRGNIFKDFFLYLYIFLIIILNQNLGEFLVLPFFFAVDVKLVL